MADAQKTGTDWQDEELDAIVADYFAMLALDAAGQPFQGAPLKLPVESELRR